MPEELVDGLVQVSFAVVARLTRVATVHELSLTQLRVLAILRDREPRMADLAEHLGQDRSSVSGLVDRAVRRGLVERRASPDDGRSTRVALTAAGRALATELAAEIADLLGELTGDLSAAEGRRLAELLGRVVSPG